MAHPTDAIVTGFVKSPALLALSLAPLRTLKQEGVLRDIHYVTWDSAEIDAHVAPLADMSDVNLVRAPQPQAEGTGNQRGVIYQVANLDAALGLVAGDDTVVLKSRPDFIIDTDFLRRKITSFDTWSAIPRERIGAQLPKPALHNKIWIPWADASQPFFYEDAAFMGRKRDLKKLLTALTPRDLEVLGDPDCGWFAHVVRYARVFASRYPIFAQYLEEFPYFVNDLDYRCTQIGTMLGDGFFWHLLIAHAWILHTQFHVDVGEQGDILFFANNTNKNADWSKPETLRLAMPYEQSQQWRETTKPGSMTQTLRRTYSRLMDDAWQDAVFTNTPPDFSREKLAAVLQNIANYRDGRMEGMEEMFYMRLEAFHRERWLERRGSPDHIAQIAGAGGEHHQPVEAHRHAG
jgi:hypothetical protein